jgi:putative membrane protein
MTATMILAITSLAASGGLLGAVGGDIDSTSILLRHLVAAVVFSIVGIVVLAISFWIMERLTPFSLTKEIEEDQNIALGIIVGSITIGISIIIAAAILG